MPGILKYYTSTGTNTNGVAVLHNRSITVGRCDGRKFAFCEAALTTRGAEVACCPCIVGVLDEVIILMKRHGARAPRLRWRRYVEISAVPRSVGASCL